VHVVLILLTTVVRMYRCILLYVIYFVRLCDAVQICKYEDIPRSDLVMGTWRVGSLKPTSPVPDL
jgi:hypothetical protein